MTTHVSDPDKSRSTTGPATPAEPVWSYRGYTLRPSEFTTAMVHYYRAEIQRSNVWRSRLDATTNWAVITAGAALSFALASPENHHSVIILDALLITIFLWIEARRYRYYELWSYRTRLMETDFYAAMLVPPFGPRPEWAESLAESLLQPDFPISIWEAFGRRLRRNYFWIFIVLAVAWILKGIIHPTLTTSAAEFVARAAIGPIPGPIVLTSGLIYFGILCLISVATAGLQQATGEVLPKYWGLTLHPADHMAPVRPPLGLRDRIFSVPTRRRRQLLALIITAEAEKVAARLLQEMHRGATGLTGQGMYTHARRDVLMIALTVTEIGRLKTLVAAEDKDAFVIVVPAQEVLGRGFAPLAEEKA
ncbi:MAG: DUF2270 domain-containing protein [Anaerolineae bacterium]